MNQKELEEKNKQKKKEKESKLDKKRNELEKELKLDQEEIIAFKYKDETNNKMIVVHDKRKIKVALLEFEVKDLEDKDIRKLNECRYNPKTDDSMDEEQALDKVLEKQEVKKESERLNRESKFVRDLEDALQETCNKIYEMRENSKKLSKIFHEHIFEFSEEQQKVIFFFYFLDFRKIEVSKILSIEDYKICRMIDRIDKKLKKFYKNMD